MMRAKVLKPFPLSRDGVTNEALSQDQVVEIPAALVAGLLAEGYIEAAAPVAADGAETKTEADKTETEKTGGEETLGEESGGEATAGASGEEDAPGGQVDGQAPADPAAGGQGPDSAPGKSKKTK